MKIVEPPKEIKNITKPHWTSIKICYNCSTKCRLESDDINVHQSAFTRVFVFDALAWTTHFWKCPVCEKLNNFHSFSYDTFLYDMEKYKKLLEFKSTVEQYGTIENNDTTNDTTTETHEDILNTSLELEDI